MNAVATDNSVYLSLVDFASHIFTHGGPERLVVDSPTIKSALRIVGRERNYQHGGSLYGTMVDRWMLPFGALIVPCGDATPELLEKVSPNNILRESDFPEQTEKLRQAIEAAA